MANKELLKQIKGIEESVIDYMNYGSNHEGYMLKNPNNGELSYIDARQYDNLMDIQEEHDIFMKTSKLFQKLHKDFFNSDADGKELLKVLGNKTNVETFLKDNGKFVDSYTFGFKTYSMYQLKDSFMNENVYFETIDDKGCPEEIRFNVRKAI